MYVCVIKVLLRLRGTEPTNHEVANASSKTRLLNNEAEWNGMGDGMTEGDNEEVQYVARVSLSRVPPNSRPHHLINL